MVGDFDLRMVLIEQDIRRDIKGQILSQAGEGWRMRGGEREAWRGREGKGNRHGCCAEL